MNSLFAASALVLHIPFHDSDELLQGQTEDLSAEDITNYVELFSTAVITEGNQITNEDVGDVIQEFPIPNIENFQSTQDESCLKLNSQSRYDMLTEPYDCNIFDRTEKQSEN